MGNSLVVITPTSFPNREEDGMEGIYRMLEKIDGFSYSKKDQEECEDTITITLPLEWGIYCNPCNSNMYREYYVVNSKNGQRP